jgi:two-component system nitrogen regulation sensor histidine kinase NtrY
MSIRRVKPLSLRSLLPVSVRRHLPRLHPRLRRRVNAGLVILLTGLAFASGLATYAALAEVPPFGNDPTTILWLLNIDLVLLLVLVALVARRIVGVWSGRRRGLAGSKLHVRLVFIFSMLALTPAVIMTIFSAGFFHYGLQGWFSDKIKNAIDQSEAFAEAYMIEHQNVIKADILAMANDLERSADSLAASREAFEKFLLTQSLLRNFSEVVIFSENGDMLMSSGIGFSMIFDTLPAISREQAASGEVVMLSTAGEERIRAMVRLNGFNNAYLYVGRMVDPMVRERLDATVRAVNDYEQLEIQRADLQVKAMMMFVVVALLLLFAAMWFGLMLARQLANPIVDMITAADRVRAGDLTARVAMEDSIDEFEVLGRAFNRMTSQIEEQRAELITANRQLDQRRRFTETVLAGVSSGVVGLDKDGKITLANSSAAQLLHVEASSLLGRAMIDLLPDLAPLLEQAKTRTTRMAQAEIAFQPPAGEGGKRTLLVRIAIELIGDQDTGAVLTFDDITDLQSAQRKAAWADVARRIAHEIKNPLTPIQLSAERLKRKYLKQIHDDPDTFEQCTDTIIHHVGDIGRMVNEFSNFARMPEAVMKPENIKTIIRDIAVFQNEAHPNVHIALKGDASTPAPFFASVDSQQIRQALTNIIQNAIDVGATKINILMLEDSARHELSIAVHDNGPGLPPGVDPERLMEPYVTHREKGTGLGLAIVKKIMDDHKGRILLSAPDSIKASPDWENLGGATFILTLHVEHIEAKAV